jgi:hypothetical protein
MAACASGSGGGARRWRGEVVVDATGFDQVGGGEMAERPPTQLWLAVEKHLDNFAGGAPTIFQFLHLTCKLDQIADFAEQIRQRRATHRAAAGEQALRPQRRQRAQAADNGEHVELRRPGHIAPADERVAAEKPAEGRLKVADVVTAVSGRLDCAQRELRRADDVFHRVE